MSYSNEKGKDKFQSKMPFMDNILGAPITRLSHVPTKPIKIRTDMLHELTMVI